MIDLKLNFLRFRHGAAARSLRRLISFVILGPGSWPAEFVRPSGNATESAVSSSNLYVHIPFCRTICPHCPYVKCRYEEGKAKCYREAIFREIDSHLENRPPGRVRTLYFGGGTPLLCPDLVSGALERFADRMCEDPEIGIELHPLDCDKHLPDWLRGQGVTHVSLGVESFDPGMLKQLGRGYGPDQAERALIRLLECGFECVDANVIYGIPGQGPESALSGAARCVEIGAHQVSAYPLIAFEGTPLGHRVRHRGDMTYGVRKRLWTQREMARVMAALGLGRTSIWSFCKPGIRPYTTVTRCDYQGFGLGAGSLLDGVFSFNTFDLEAYCKQQRPGPALCLKAGERSRRLHWLYWAAYRTRINGAEYRARFCRDLDRDFRSWFRVLSGLGLARKNGEEWRLTDRGADWVHRLQSLFSLSFIDQLWSRCKTEAWPERVVLK
jgi:oxygen-independent coproporphyrinogen-3 oxidase